MPPRLIAVIVVAAVALTAASAVGILALRGDENGDEANEQQRTPDPPVLTPVTEFLEPPTVWIYEDATPDSTRCTEILGDIVPVAAAGSVPAKEFTCGGVDLSRLRFAADQSGTMYLQGAEILVPAKSTLPTNRPGRDCNDVRQHLVPAAEPAQKWPLGLVCDVQPLPRDETADDPLSIWAQVVVGQAPPSIPAGMPCWELTKYLGPGGEGATIDVQCVLQ